MHVLAHVLNFACVTVSVKTIHRGVITGWKRTCALVIWIKCWQSASRSRSTNFAPPTSAAGGGLSPQILTNAAYYLIFTKLMGEMVYLCGLNLYFSHSGGGWLSFPVFQSHFYFFCCGKNVFLFAHFPAWVVALLLTPLLCVSGYFLCGL